MKTYCSKNIIIFNNPGLTILRLPIVADVDTYY